MTKKNCGKLVDIFGAEPKILQFLRNLAKEAGLKHGRRLSEARLLSPHIIIDQNDSVCSHLVDPSLTHFLGEFPGLALALEPDTAVPEAEQGCAWRRNLDPNFCLGRGRTSDLGI